MLLLARYWKQILIVALVIAAVAGIYWKGYSDKSHQIEKQQLQATIELMQKVKALEDFSREESKKAQESTKIINTQLDTVLIRIKPRVVVTQDCKPNQEFANSWNDLNNGVKYETSKPIK